MSGQRLTWDEIASAFNSEWVELVDYDWPEGTPYPREGVVRSHSGDRRDFYTQANREPKPEDSAILFVGTPSTPAPTFLCSSLMRIEHADS